MKMWIVILQLKFIYIVLWENTHNAKYIEKQVIKCIEISERLIHFAWNLELLHLLICGVDGVVMHHYLQQKH